MYTQIVCQWNYELFVYKVTYEQRLILDFRLYVAASFNVRHMKYS